MGKIWARRALLASGWRECVAIEFDDHGIVSSIEADTTPSGDSFGLLLPAPVNVHSHAFQRAMSGWTEHRGPDGTDSFWTWRQWMFRFLERLTPEQVEAITAYAQMEMLEAGYAASVEFHYLHHQVDGFPYSNVAEMSERVLSAAQRTGIGLTLLPVHYEFGGCDRRPLVQGQRRFGNRFDQYAAIVESASKAVRHLPADCSIGTASHSLRAVAPEDIARVRAIFPRGRFICTWPSNRGRSIKLWKSTECDPSNGYWSISTCVPMTVSSIVRRCFLTKPKHWLGRASLRALSHHRIESRRRNF